MRWAVIFFVVGRYKLDGDIDHGWMEGTCNAQIISRVSNK